MVENMDNESFEDVDNIHHIHFLQFPEALKALEIVDDSENVDYVLRLACYIPIFVMAIQNVISMFHCFVGWPKSLCE